MLQTLHFVPRPQDYCQRVLGVIVSQAVSAEDVHFSVPAHVLFTFNVVLRGSLMRGNQELPASFVTGAHTRSRRYRLSKGAILLTLFCRADVSLDLCRYRPAELTDRWLAAQEVFSAWQEPGGTMDALQCAQAMLICVDPVSLPRLSNPKSQQAAQCMSRVVQALMSQDLAASAANLHMSERTMQRLFRAQWGISPKLVQRLLRVQQCVDRWQSNDQSLADLASQVGLADQAHLAREFRQLVGYPPSHLKRSTPFAQDGTLWALRTGHRLLAPLLTD